MLTSAAPKWKAWVLFLTYGNEDGHVNTTDAGRRCYGKRRCHVHCRFPCWIHIRRKQNPTTVLHCTRMDSKIKMGEEQIFTPSGWFWEKWPKTLQCGLSCHGKPVCSERVTCSSIRGVWRILTGVVGSGPGPPSWRYVWSLLQIGRVRFTRAANRVRRSPPCVNRTRPFNSAWFDLEPLSYCWVHFSSRSGFLQKGTPLTTRGVFTVVFLTWASKFNIELCGGIFDASSRNGRASPNEKALSMLHEEGATRKPRSLDNLDGFGPHLAAQSLDPPVRTLDPTI